MSIETRQHPPGRSSGRLNRSQPGLLVSIVLSIVVLAVLLWQLAGVAEDRHQLQVLNPGLHWAWESVLVSTLALSVGCSALVWVRRRWTMPVALVNAAANVAGAATVFGLTWWGDLLAPVTTGRQGATDGTRSDVADLTELFLLLVAVAAIWDSVDGLVRARRGRSSAVRDRACTPNLKGLR